MKAGRWSALLAVVVGLAAAAATTTTTTTTTTAPSAVNAEPRRSGLLDMSPALQAMQRDDAQNPAALWLKAGEQRFSADCVRCHSAASMAGVAARYPAWDAKAGKPLTLSGRINACRVRHLSAPQPWAPESDELLALETFVARASRGLPIAPSTPPAATPKHDMSAWRARGQQLWRQPFGQLGLSCTQCHDAQAGGKLAGSTIPQGHPTGYPIYRLEWQGMGSLQRRIRNCMTGVRAEPFDWNSDEMTALEAYLMQRAAGLPMETPAVRP